MYVSQMERNFKRKSEKGHHSEGYTIRRIEKDIKTVVHKLVLQSLWYKKKKKNVIVSPPPPRNHFTPLMGPSPAHFENRHIQIFCRYSQLSLVPITNLEMDLIFFLKSF